MGSWLLTRETCAALSAVISAKNFSPPESLVDQSAMLLINTLTSLKHAGAAFAAHRALQQIVTSCFDETDASILQLPSMWTHRLLEEISATDKVRDSTLRRSTGYALGFLSIMRSEIATQVDPRSLCPFILSNILRLSLPAEEDLEVFLDKLKLKKNDTSIFTYLSSHSKNASLVTHKSYEVSKEANLFIRLLILCLA